MLPYILIALLLGTLTEALAYALSLWWYRNAWMRIPNVLIVFGLVFGALSWLTAQQSLLVQFVPGAVLGLAYEFANDRWLKIWHFPGDPWTWLTGRRAVIGVGLAWGFVPPLVVWLVWTLA